MGPGFGGGSDQSRERYLRKASVLRPSDPIVTDIDCSFFPKREVANGVYPALVHITHVVPDGKGATGIRQFPLVPSFERDIARRGDNLAPQRALVGDPLNDEQRSDYLPNPSSHQTTRPKIGVVGKHKPGSA